MLWQRFVQHINRLNFEEKNTRQNKNRVEFKIVSNRTDIVRIIFNYIVKDEQGKFVCTVMSEKTMENLKKKVLQKVSFFDTVVYAWPSISPLLQSYAVLVHYAKRFAFAIENPIGSLHNFFGKRPPYPDTDWSCFRFRLWLTSRLHFFRQYIFVFYTLYLRYIRVSSIPAEPSCILYTVHVCPQRECVGISYLY